MSNEDNKFLTNSDMQEIHENQSRQEIEEIARSMKAHAGIPCEIHGKAIPAFACNHVVQQDPVHPDGIFRLPSGIFLCKKCYDLFERRRFNWHSDQFRVKCYACVMAEVQRLRAKDLSLYVDMSAGEDNFTGLKL